MTDLVLTSEERALILKHRAEQEYYKGVRAGLIMAAQKIENLAMQSGGGTFTAKTLIAEIARIDIKKGY